MVSWIEVELEEGKWYEIPVFRVEELTWILRVAPTTIRTWIQRYWLSARRDRKGYKISLVNLASFLDHHGSKLRSLPSTDLQVLISERYWPKDIPENRQEELRKTKRMTWHRDKYKEYQAWVGQTYDVRKKLLSEKLLGKKLPFTEFVDELTAIDDCVVAEKSGVALPEKCYEAIRDIFLNKDGVIVYEAVPVVWDAYGMPRSLYDFIRTNDPMEIKRSRLNWKAQNDDEIERSKPPFERYEYRATKPPT
jgi:hypothetical protein